MYGKTQQLTAHDSQNVGCRGGLWQAVHTVQSRHAACSEPGLHVCNTSDPGIPWISGLFNFEINFGHSFRNLLQMSFGGSYIEFLASYGVTTEEVGPCNINIKSKTLKTQMGCWDVCLSFQC